MPDFATFDRRHYPEATVRDGYRDWVPTYEDTVEDRMDQALLERLTRVDWSALRRVADLGCGTGRTGAWLAARGARHLSGVDLTPEMLERARARDLYARLSVGDVRTTQLEAGVHDLVICCLVDEHLPALTELYAEAARLLAPTGAFVLVGFHPFFVMAAGMPTHFDHPQRGPLAIETYVHLFEEHVAAADAAGLVARELVEGVVDEGWIEAKPRWERHRGWPVSFAWVWQR